MSHTQSDAERKFWRSPELLERLIPLLDASSASNLAEAHPFTVEVLLGGSIWEQLVENCCKYWESTRQEFEGTLEQKRLDMGHLINILKKMENCRTGYPWWSSEGAPPLGTELEGLPSEWND